MSKRNLYWVIIGFVLLFSLTGCLCDNDAVKDMQINLISPAGGEVVDSLNPTFTWDNDQSCNPDKYSIDISEDIYFSNHYAQDSVPFNELPYTLTGTSLQPGHAYYWDVLPQNDSKGEEPYASGSWSGREFFYTGPVCSGEALVAPDLILPMHHGSPDIDDWITHDNLQEFMWTYNGTCLPVSYDYQFATDSGFTNVILEGTTSEPYVQRFYANFPNCSTIFWRIAANDGNTSGSWSNTWSFHWVTDDTCHQTKFISDDAARIRVILYEDGCEITGLQSPTRVKIGPGCLVDKQNLLVRGDGVFSIPPDHYISDFIAALGSGPCPSTGLDSKRLGLDHDQDLFHVLTPGTYCVSITRSQVVDTYSSEISLLKGIWTDPRTYEIVAMKTLEFEAGMQDVEVYFGWDRVDRIILEIPLEKSLNCRFTPYTGCPIADIALTGEIIPIFARDTNSDWKLSAMNGTPCYIFLPNAVINEGLEKMEGFDWRAEDLEFFPQPPPCAPPAPERRSCTDHNSEEACIAAGCTWDFVGEGSCRK